MTNPIHASGAVISDCGLYRYLLWRSWGEPDGARAIFLMLNPSTADASSDDQTIRKCIGFARRWGMHGIQIVNLFAYRSTDPKALAALAADVAVGDRNMEHIADHFSAAGAFDRIVCAWGCTGGSAVKKMIRQRLLFMRSTLRATPGLLCLGTSQDGSPRHPCMLAYDTPLQPWSAP